MLSVGHTNSAMRAGCSSFSKSSLPSFLPAVCCDTCQTSRPKGSLIFNASLYCKPCASSTFNVEKASETSVGTLQSWKVSTASTQFFRRQRTVPWHEGDGWVRRPDGGGGQDRPASPRFEQRGFPSFCCQQVRDDGQPNGPRLMSG